jgi:DnaJ-class molecular chaperone
MKIGARCAMAQAKAMRLTLDAITAKGEGFAWKSMNQNMKRMMMAKRKQYERCDMCEGDGKGLGRGSICPICRGKGRFEIDPNDNRDELLDDDEVDEWALLFGIGG